MHIFGQNREETLSYYRVKHGTSIDVDTTVYLDKFSPIK